MPKKQNEHASFWMQLREAERNIITFTLEHVTSIRQAALALGVSSNYLSKRVRKLKIAMPPNIKSEVRTEATPPTPKAATPTKTVSKPGRDAPMPSRVASAARAQREAEAAEAEAAYAAAKVRVIPPKLQVVKPVVDEDELEDEDEDEFDDDDDEDEDEDEDEDDDDEDLEDDDDAEDGKSSAVLASGAQDEDAEAPPESN